MNKKDKLLQRFYGMPKDFTFDELKALFGIYGFTVGNKGATSGSRVEFVNEERNLSYITHKPHPGNIIKTYMMKQVTDYLKRNGFINKQDKQ